MNSANWRTGGSGAASGPGQDPPLRGRGGHRGGGRGRSRGSSRSRGGGRSNYRGARGSLSQGSAEGGGNGYQGEVSNNNSLEDDNITVPSPDEQVMRLEDVIMSNMQRKGSDPTNTPGNEYEQAKVTTRPDENSQLPVLPPTDEPRSGLQNTSPVPVPGHHTSPSNEQSDPNAQNQSLATVPNDEIPQVSQSSTNIRDPALALTSNDQDTQIDNHTDSNKQDQSLESSGQIAFDSCLDNLPCRPAYGTQGDQLVVYANYFPMEFEKDKIIYVYRMNTHRTDLQTGQGQPLIPKMKLHGIIRKLIATNEDFNGNDTRLATDHAQTLYSATPLNTGSSKVYDVEAGPRTNVQKYRVTLTASRTIRVANIQEFLESQEPQSTFSQRSGTIQAINIILDHHTRSDSATVAFQQNKVFKDSVSSWQRRYLGQGLYALRGLFSSARVATNRLLLNLNVAYGAFYNSDDSLGTLMQEYGLTSGIELERFLKTLKVVTKYQRANASRSTLSNASANKVGPSGIGSDTHQEPSQDVGNQGGDLQGTSHHHVTQEDPSLVPVERKYTILSLAHKNNVKDDEVTASKPRILKDWAGADEVKLRYDGQIVSVKDYFDQEHGIRLRHAYLPVVDVGMKGRPIFVPPELCKVLPNQPCRIKLTPEQMKEMMKLAVRRPADNKKSLTQDVNAFARSAPTLDNKLDQFGISVKKDMVTVQARVRQSPAVQYTGEKPFRLKLRGSWNLEDSKFVGGKESSDWCCVNLSSEENEVLKVQINRLATVWSKYTGQPSPILFEPVSARPSDTDCIVKELEAASKNRRLLLIVLPNDTGAKLYNLIKTDAEIRLGVRTLCVRQRTLDRFARNQLFANLALKINLKLGGINHSVQSALVRQLHQTKTMVVGLDVTHPSPGSHDNAPSIAGIVASVDEHLAQWPADVRIQKQSRVEMISELQEMMESRLRLWKEHNGAYPDNVLIYRDGVSEGQYQLVVRIELPAIQKAFQKLYGDGQESELPRATIVIVGKRHHTRFYPTNDSSGDGKTGNCEPGTVVDRGITEARRWDFYLQSHAAIQGTARPAHYEVIWDEIFTGSRSGRIPDRRWAPSNGQGNPQDVLEELTLAMTYAFGRATRAISTPAPARYADMVCERARAYISRLFEPDANDDVSEASQREVTVHESLKDEMFYI